jgi:hypothetical protein
MISYISLFSLRRNVDVRDRKGFWEVKVLFLDHSTQLHGAKELGMIPAALREEGRRTADESRPITLIPLNECDLEFTIKPA